MPERLDRVAIALKTGDVTFDWGARGAPGASGLEDVRATTTPLTAPGSDES